MTGTCIQASLSYTKIGTLMATWLDMDMHIYAEVTKSDMHIAYYVYSGSTSLLFPSQ